MTAPEQWQEIDRIFAAALELEAAQRREDPRFAELVGSVRFI